MDKKEPIKIPVNPVKSSNIKGIGYHPETQTMAVKFSNGIYHYNGVTEKEFQAFQKAESIGKHFHSVIRGKFKGVKV
jgi:hypothetical protein